MSQKSLSQNDDDVEQADNAELRRLLAQREREINALLNSTSWRITAPLRALSRWIEKSRLLLGRRAGSCIDPHEYRKWVQKSASVTPEARRLLASSIQEFASKPLISVLFPNYNIDPRFVSAAIESVLRQVYPHWELCISDDASTIAGTRELLEDYASKDSRIRLNSRAVNGNISVNSNDALALATGGYVALLDADDLLSEDALFWVAQVIAAHPEADLIYSDEDKFDETQGRFDPHFKTAWNPALMLSLNAFSHLGVFRRSLVDKVGGFREGFEGAQDYDLVLRCADATTPDRIRHIPRVLYHWRASAGSTAEGAPAKPYAWRAGRRAIEQHLKRRNIRGHVVPALEAFYQLKFDAVEPPPFVNIIMPTALNNLLARSCIESLLTKTTYRNFELLILASDEQIAAARTDPKFEASLGDPRVRLRAHQSAPISYFEMINTGASQATGKLLCFLSDVIEVIDGDWLGELVARVTLDGVGAAGPMLYGPPDRIAQAGILLGVGGVADRAFRNLDRNSVGYFARSALEQDYSSLTAACLLMRRDVFEAVGGFDVGVPVLFGDVDLCIRVRLAGLRLIWTPAVSLYHHAVHRMTPDGSSFASDVASIRGRWQAILDNDPHYNPNLSLDPQRQFQLMTPPRIPGPPNNGPSGPLAETSRTSALGER